MPAPSPANDFFHGFRQMSNTSSNLIESLLEYLVGVSEGEAPRLLETHISWVILAGSHAWKIKKPVNFGFLDFSTLAKRRACCEEEVRLNRRLAPDYYLGVVSITRGKGGCRFDGEGPVVEYAVKMKRFDSGKQLDRLLEAGELSGDQMDAIADLVARFHLSGAAVSRERGHAEQVCEPARDNFRHIEQLRGAALPPVFKDLHEWNTAACRNLRPVMEARRRGGWIRECHGDLHLANMAWDEGAPLIFDCIEFNEGLRWIDLMSEAAFLFMDLHARGSRTLGWRFLNRYLEHTGDYEGLRLFRFYLAYRAMVRAKIAALRFHQLPAGKEKEATEEEFLGYLRLADSFRREQQPRLVITRGLSGSGKSTYSGILAEKAGFIRLRSDVERKRLVGLVAADGAGAAPEQGIYTPAMSEKTYGRLLELSGLLLDSGYSVIVDAAFLRREQRTPFMRLAADRGLPFRILELVATPDELRRRLAARRDDVSDADAEVLEYQLASMEPLSDEEQARAVILDTESGADPDEWLSLTTAG